jgi:hypothetical protein
MIDIMKKEQNFPEDHWYAAYKRKKGTHDRATFDANMVVFDRMIVPAYTYGEGDRDVAMKAWVTHLDGDVKEAHRYFMAVDSVTCLS